MPVAGEARFRRGLVEQVEGLGFSGAPAGRAGGLEAARSARASASRKRRLSARVGLLPPPATERKRSIASSSAAIACSRGLGSPGVRAPASRPALSLRPAIDSRLKPHLPLAGRLGILLEEPVEQIDRLRPAAAARLRIGRRLGGPIERAGHLEGQLFAAGEVERQILDLIANGRQMPRELGVGRGLLGSRRHGQGDQPPSQRQG